MSETKSQKPVVVLITGAAGNIGYHVTFAIARGSMLGKNQPLELRLLEIPPCMTSLNGVVMELEDCAFKLVTKIVATSDYEEAFKGIDIALLVGSRPRGPGMKRGDLIQANAKIFEGQGKALDKWAKKSVKVLVVGNPANTNALITSHNAPSLPKTAFTCLTRLDQNRAKYQLSAKLKEPISAVKKVAIWGNHSSTQVPDCSHSVVIRGGKETSPDLDEKWVDETFIPTVQTRGKAIIAARKLSSAASAANAIIMHVKDWVLGTPKGDWSSMGIMTDGKTYGIPAGLMFSFPCICKNGVVTPVLGLSISKKTKARIVKTTEELQHEKSLVIKS